MEKNNIEFVDRMAIERDGYAPGGGHIGKPSKDDTRKWLEELRKDPDRWQMHIEREVEYQERKAQEYLY